MKTQFLTFILSLLAFSLMAQESFTVTVVPNKITYGGTGDTDLYGNPVKGVTFGLAGYIYPADYFDNHCPDSKDCGISVVLTQDTVYTLPDHPDEVIGRWDMYGTTTQDWATALANGGTATLSTHVFLFKKEFELCPECKLVTEGKDIFGGATNVANKRTITGGTTAAYKLMTGEVDQIIYQQPENKNETSGYNMQVTFRFYKN